jgi:hypothetical protein
LQAIAHLDTSDLRWTSLVTNAGTSAFRVDIRENR